MAELVAHARGQRPEVPVRPATLLLPGFPHDWPAFDRTLVTPGAVPATFVLPHIAVYCLDVRYAVLPCERCGAADRLAWVANVPVSGRPAPASRVGWLLCPGCVAATEPTARVEWRQATEAPA